MPDKKYHEHLRDSIHSAILARPGGFLLEEIIKAFGALGFYEGEIRSATNVLHNENLIYVDWEWYYKATKPEDGS